MYTLVKIELIKEFLSNYGIDYNLLTIDTQSIIVTLSNIFFLLTIFVGLYIIYRLINRLF